MKLGIEPVERGADIINLTNAMIVFCLAESCATKIEAEHRESKAVQRFHRMEHDFVVQRSTEQRMWMADNCSVSRVLCSRIEQRFETSCGTFEE